MILCRLILCLIALRGSLQATDYTQMAQEMVRESYALQSEAQEGVQDFLNHPEKPESKPIKILNPAVPHSGMQKTCPSGVCQAATLMVKPKQTHPEGSQVLIFVSFSLPEASLQAYARDVAKIGGRLVFQGLVDDSFQATQAQFLKLGIEADMDPPLFEKFTVTRVPLIVHAPLVQGEWDVQRADRLLGHVSLTHALEQFCQKGAVAGCDELLKQLTSGDQ